LLSFQARRRCKQQGKQNSKDDVCSKAKAVYHCMNELAEDTDKNNNDEDKGELSDDGDKSDSNMTM
jgi:hypothetical protein